MAAPALAITSHRSEGHAHAPDWKRVAYLLHLSRALDDIEESKLLPERKVLYQFSARGHDFAQILLGLNLTDPHDGVTVYYRSRPLMLALGVDLEDAAAGPLARAGSFSDGRDIGVVFNIEQHRQALCGCNRERRPESVCCNGGIPTQDDSDTAGVSDLIQYLAGESDCLRPPGRGGVLSAYPAAGRQHGSASAARHVEDHSDIAAVAERAGTSQRTGCSVFQINTQRQHERS